MMTDAPAENHELKHGRVIAIGDVHGCDVALRAILHAIAPKPNDTVVMLGDVVDRGPNTRATLEILMELRDRCHLKLIRGNHEEMMLNVVAFGQPPQPWLPHGGDGTLESYGSGGVSAVPKDHVEFLKSFLPYFETTTHIFLHANYQYDKPLAEQTGQYLRWISLGQHLPGKHVSGKTAIVGHTSEKNGEVFNNGHLICLDTYCHGGGWLTAMDVNSGEIWQADREGQMRQ